MKVQNINLSPHFKGFKNVVSHTDYLNDGTTTVSYMSMELDNIGQSDLDEWQLLQRELMNKDEISDYVVISQTNNEIINILTMDESLICPEATVMSSREELLHIKAISLIASLTKRIQTFEFTTETKDLHKVVAKTITMLSKLFHSEEYGGYLSIAGAMKKVKHYKTAELINSQIAKRMAIYFK